MKGSVVFRSWKTWAEKLHQQLPLTPRESQRLLTALTTSFRKHLDEAHPPTASHDGRPTGVPTKSKLQERPLHASAAVSADKHLASILTNPLLAKGAGGENNRYLHEITQTRTQRAAGDEYTSVRIELEKGVKNPITIFEEYAERGIASPRIARACLQSFESLIEHQTAERKRTMISESRPGKRVLLAMWKRDLHQSEAFVDDTELIRLLTFALMRDGLDDYLWDWIKIDMGLADHLNKLGNGPVSQSYSSHMYHRYRWKGRILRGMVTYWVDSRYHDRGDINAALDVFQKALELREAGTKQNGGHREGFHHLRWLPLGAAGTALAQALIKPMLPHRHATTDRPAFTPDPARFDRFAAAVNLWAPFGNELDETGPNFQSAVLQLRHPVNPSARRFVSVAKRWFAEHGPDAKETSQTVDTLRLTSGPQAAQQHWFCTLVRAIYLSELHGAWEDARWLRDTLALGWPDLRHLLQRDLQLLRRLREHDLAAAEDNA